MPASPLRLAALLPLSLALAGACTDDDGAGEKQIQVDNQADVALRVEVGATDFGNVPAATLTAPRDVANGALEVRVDGALFHTFELGSDNVSGLWTLTLDRIEVQPGQFQVFGGITAE
ncbi:MAG: hypothetical protein JNK64_05530 [Myxococcales bacterium]|nr:hypothetical protein [Myxococcales bacterium]